MEHKQLAETVMGAYKTHISELINDHQTKRGFDNMADVSRDLDYHSALMRDWAGGTTVSFPKYFDFRLRLDGETSATRDEMKINLEDSLKGHLAATIASYRGNEDENRKSLKQVAEEFGYSQSMIIEIAAARAMSSPIMAFGILAKTQDKATVDSVFIDILI